jgi:hypothetical protein
MDSDFFWKNYQAGWPSFSALYPGMKSAEAENYRERLTQENHISRLALLNSHWFVGIFWEPLHCREAERGEFLPSSAANEQLPEGFGPVRLSHLRPKAPGRGVRGRPVEKIPGSARYEHDKKRGNTGGNPPSGPEKPELPFLVLFTPRKNNDNAKPSGEDANTEIESWNCACI